jgi:hypothetical protein
VREEVFTTAIGSNEAKTLRIVKPFYGPSCHCYIP